MQTELTIGEKYRLSVEDRHKKNLGKRFQSVGTLGADIGAIVLFHLMYWRIG